MEHIIYYKKMSFSTFINNGQMSDDLLDYEDFDDLMFKKINQITDTNKSPEEQIKDIISLLGVNEFSKKLINWVKENNGYYEVINICKNMIPSPIPQTTPSPFQTTPYPFQMTLSPSPCLFQTNIFDSEESNKDNDNDNYAYPKDQVSTPPQKRKNYQLGIPALKYKNRGGYSRLREVQFITHLSEKDISSNEDSILVNHSKIPRLFVDIEIFKRIFTNETKFSIFHDDKYDFYQLVSTSHYFEAIQYGNIKDPAVFTIAYKNIQNCRNCSRQTSFKNGCYKECAYMHQHWRDLYEGYNIACRILDNKNKEEKKFICDIPVLTLERSII